MQTPPPRYHNRVYDITNKFVLIMLSKACVPICHSIDYLSQPLWLVLIFKWVELLLWQADNCRVDFVDVSADQCIAKSIQFITCT